MNDATQYILSSLTNANMTLCGIGKPGIILAGRYEKAAIKLQGIVAYAIQPGKPYMYAIAPRDKADFEREGYSVFYYYDDAKAIETR